MAGPIMNAAGSMLKHCQTPGIPLHTYLIMNAFSHATTGANRVSF